MSDSDTYESPTSPPEAPLQNNPDIMSDVIFWKRKQLNAIILFVVTSAWIVMEVYQYSFVTVLSWVAMAIITCLFFWGNIHCLLKKEAPDLSELEISEETAMEHANSLRRWADEGVRLVFHVSAEREWFVFAGAVSLLYLISVVAKHFHFLTLLYIGVLGAMTIPVIYVKQERKISELGERVRTTTQRLNSIMKDNFQKVRNKIGGQPEEIKEKKLE